MMRDVTLQEGRNDGSAVDSVMIMFAFGRVSRVEIICNLFNLKDSDGRRQAIVQDRLQILKRYGGRGLKSSHLTEGMNAGVSSS